MAPICPANHFYSTDYDTCLELTEDTPTFSCLSNNFSYDSNTGLCNSIYDEPPQCMNGYSHNPITDACEQILMAPVCDNANGFFYDPDKANPEDNTESLTASFLRRRRGAKAAVFLMFLFDEI